jgi:HEAT repeat protein/beta-lactamase regulating signal transducer with metallopeptidase domain
MDPLFDVVSFSSQTGHWFGLLLDLAIKGAFILSVASLSAFALRRSSAAMRHLVWNLALVSLLALPALTFMLPRWNVPVLPGLLARPEAEADARETDAASAGVLQAAIQDAARRALSAAPGSDASGATGVEASRPVQAVRSPMGRFHWSVWILALWLVGSFLVAARLAAGLASVWWITRRSRRVEDRDWTDLVREISWQLGLSRPVALLESERVGMPLTWGLFRPVILMPPDTADWAEERRRVVLSHELAHVKRRDCLTQTLAQAACAIYWFNPLVWMAARKLRMERERACDDHVLHTGTRASDYASHLLDLARSLGSSSCSATTAVAIARRSQLEGRLLAILDPDVSRRGINRAGASLALIVMICLVLPLAAVSPLADDSRSNGEQSQPERASRESRHDQAASRAETGGKDLREAITPAEPADKKSEDEQPASVDAPDQTHNVQLAQEPQDPQQEQSRQTGESGIVESLKSALKDSDWEVRKHAAWSLGLKGDHTAVESLIEALKDEHPDVREQAAWALGLKGDSRAVRPLAAALKDQHSGVREQAAWALGLKGNREAVEPLIEALRDDDSQVREQAAWALGLKGDRRAVEPLMDALKDGDDGVREQAAWALGLKGDRRSLPALKDALKDPSGQVRDQARWAIGMILVRGGGASSAGDDDDKEFEFEFDSKQLSNAVGEIVSKMAGKAASATNYDLNVNVNPDPSPRGKGRNNR